MGKFVIKTGKTGVRFNLLAGNGQVIGTSEIYKADASCLNGIDSVRRCSAGGIQDLTDEGALALKAMDETWLSLSGTIELLKSRITAY